tara:strand:+ start:632 stop:1765 length:1134 start_codon:yes stop_codon:yes gene_type:complete
MSEIRVNTLGNESNTGGPVLSGITTFSGQQYFIPPKGTTSERPSGCPPGSIRFNTDSAHLEYWNGLVWLEFEASSEELGDQNNTDSTGGTGTRGIYGGGSTPSKVQTTNFFTISTQGNARSFGDLVGAARIGSGGCASRTRGYIVGGATPSRTAEIDTLVFSSTGSCTDYGDLSRVAATQSCSSSTRGFSLGGSAPSTIATIDYFALESTGSGIDFGDLTEGDSGGGACASSIRGIYWKASTPNQIGIDFITMSTLGNAVDFGDKTVSRSSLRACSNSVRGVCAGGFATASPNPAISTIDFITIASTGNAQDFGDMSVNNPGNSQACASSIRGVWSGGTDATMQFIEIMSTGNSIDFGDLTANVDNGAACSNGHGGL